MLKKRKLTQQQFIAYAGVFSAIAIVLLYLDVPYPFANWLKLDFSEVIVLLAGSINIFLGIAVALIKAFLGLILPPTAAPIGYVSMAIGSLTLVLVYYFAHKKLSKGISLVLASAAFCFAMFISNYFFINPFYMGMSLSEMQAATYSIPFADGDGFSYMIYNLALYLPFNIMKMLVVSVAFYFIEGRLNRG